VPQILADDVLPGTKYLPEYVICDVLSRIGTMPLNQLMGTAERAENDGCSGNDGASTTTFSIHFFQNILSADYATRCINSKQQIPKRIVKGTRLFSQFNSLSSEVLSAAQSSRWMFCLKFPNIFRGARSAFPEDGGSDECQG
jgi:hypothetical protein